MGRIDEGCRFSFDLVTLHVKQADDPSATCLIRMIGLKTGDPAEARGSNTMLTRGTGDVWTSFVNLVPLPILVTALP